MKSCEPYKPLLMGLLDGELTPEEASDVNDHLTRCNDCRKEYDELRQTCNKINAVSFKEPDEALLESLWKPPYHRASKLSGLFLLFGGWALLICYTLIQFFTSDTETVIPKISIAAILFGFVVLVLHLVRERIIKYKADPYKEVIR